MRPDPRPPTQPAAGRLWPGGLPAAVVTAVLGGVAAGFLFAGLAVEVSREQPLVLADLRVSAWIAGRRVAWLTALARAVTTLGSAVVLVPLLVAAGAWFGRRRRWGAVIVLAVGYLGAVGLYSAAKVLIARARPEAAVAAVEQAGWAFPSGHATGSVVVYGLLALLLAGTLTRPWRRASLCAGAAVIVLAVGATRVYLGVHWLSDVVAGWALGALWLALLATSLTAVRRWPGGPGRPRRPQAEAAP